MLPRRMRKSKRKGKKTSKRGQMKNNTKVDLVAKYRINTEVVALSAQTVPGTYVWYAWSPQHANYTNVGQCPEFNVTNKLYDEFCVSSVRVTFRPYLSQTLPANLGGTNSYASYTFIDRDGNAPVSAALDVPTKLLTYDSVKVSRNFKTWSRTMKTKPFWCDTGTPTINPTANAGNSQPWTNAGLCQQLGFYAQGLGYGVNTSIGVCEVDYYVKFRGKKPTAFAYDPVSGSVILTPMSSYAPLPVGNPPKDVSLIDNDETVACVDGEIQITSNLDNSVAEQQYISSISYTASVPYDS